jgi:hypothetical protein
MLTFARQKAEGVKIWDQMGRREDLLIRRPALHAAVLEFAHPMTDETIAITAPLYDDMAGVLRTLRERRPKSGPLKAQGARVNLDKLMNQG